MRIAYIISTYKNPGQLVRLVQRLYTTTSIFFIHIDRRTDDEAYRLPVRILSRLPDVHFLSRHKCYWGGFGHVEATIKGINALIASRSAFDYAVLLTGQDYPIKGAGYIQDLLRRDKGRIYMEFSRLPHEGWERGGMDRIKYWHFRPLAGYCRSLAQYSHDALANGFRQPFLLSLLPIRRTFPTGFEPFGGSSYWCFPRDCIEYVHDFISDNRSFVEFFRHVDVPDEIFFQTIVLNSSLRSRVINDDLRYISWKGPESASPAVLGKDDWEAIKRSPKLFARKFDISVDADIFDMIDRDILMVS